MENVRTSVVIARDQSMGDRGEGEKSGESSVNSIRIALVYIRGQDSPRAILPSRISTARRADYVRGRGIDGTPFSRRARYRTSWSCWIGPLHLAIVLDFWVKRIN